MTSARILNDLERFLHRRHTIIHYHIFKNAGTSVDFSLSTFFGSRWLSFEGHDAHDILPASKLTDLLMKNRGLQAVSTHLGRPPLPAIRCYPITFLRQPLLRAYSVYNFVKNDVSQPQHEIARRGSFADFLDYCIANYFSLGRVICNYQTFHLSRASFRFNDPMRPEIVEADLEEVKLLLRSWQIVGIVEHYKASIDRYNALYSKFFPGLSMQFQHENRTDSDSIQFEDRIDSITRIINSATLSRFYEANELDYRLYSWALLEFCYKSA